MSASPTQVTIDLVLKALGADVAARSFTKVERALAAGQKAVTALDSQFEKLAKTVKKLIIPVGFTQSLNILEKYTKTLASASVAANRYGMSAQKLEQRLTSLSNKTVLLRTTVADLYTTYARGFPTSSYETFDKVIENVTKSFGSNKEVIAMVVGEIKSLSNQFPDLVKNIANLRKNGIIDPKAADNLKRVADALRGTKAITRDTQRILGQLTTDLNPELDKTIKMFQGFRLYAEELGIEFGKALLPAAKKFLEVLEQMLPTIKSFAEAATTGMQYVADNFSKVAGIAIGLYGTLKAMKALRLGQSLAAKGGLLGLGAAGGAGGRLFRGGLKFGPAGIVAGLGAVGLGMGANAVGRDTAAGKAMGVGAGVLGVGAAAATGAAIGSVVPGVGTLIGGVAGGALGLWSEWSTIFGKVEEKKKKIVEEQNEIIETQKKVVEKTAQQLAEEQKITEELSKQGRLTLARDAMTENSLAFITKFNELLSEQRGEYDSILLSMQAMGQVDMSKLNTSVAEQITTIRKLNKERAVLMGILSDKDVDTATKARALVGNTGNFSELAGYSGRDVTTIAQADITKGLVALGKERIRQESDIQDIRLRQIDAFSEELKQTKETSSLMQGLVSLADNFAIGVGASVKMRMQAVSALQKEVGIVEEQMRTNQEQIAAAKAAGADREATFKLETQTLELQNRRLQGLQQIANLTKQLRDGWVSAIGSMNTGAGTFTKIVLAQNQNIAQSLRMGGLVSSFTGASARGPGGQMQGFITAPRYTSRGPEDITGGGGAYITSVGGRTPINAGEIVAQTRNALINADVVNLTGPTATKGGVPFSSLFPSLSQGGIVPGSGRGDTVPTLLEPGELVIPNSMIQRMQGGGTVEPWRQYMPWSHRGQGRGILGTPWWKQLGHRFNRAFFGGSSYKEQAEERKEERRGSTLAAWRASEIATKERQENPSIRFLNRELKKRQARARAEVGAGFPPDERGSTTAAIRLQNINAYNRSLAKPIKHGRWFGFGGSLYEPLKGMHSGGIVGGGGGRVVIGGGSSPKLDFGMNGLSSAIMKAQAKAEQQAINVIAAGPGGMAGTIARNRYNLN